MSMKTRISFLLLQDDFDADELVAFDEFGGVITDQERLRKIKEERRQEQKDERIWRKKNKSKSIKAAKSEKLAKSKKRKHKSKKRKRARKHKHASSDSSSTADESDERDEQPSNRKSKKRARRRKSCDVEDGELSESSSISDSSGNESDSEDSRSSGDVDRHAEGKEGKGVATFASGGRFQGLFNLSNEKKFAFKSNLDAFIFCIIFLKSTSSYKKEMSSTFRYSQKVSAFTAHHCAGKQFGGSQGG
uniref:Uncharacterized protein n=1 Tax=Bactrocera latifrons TaxID=174628 RepID=A0A0K8VNP4_BACLA